MLPFKTVLFGKTIFTLAKVINSTVSNLMLWTLPSTPLMETKSPRRNGLLKMIKIPLARLLKESFKAKPIAKATVPKETSKPDVDNSRTEAAIKTAKMIMTILRIETMNVSIAPSRRVFNNIFFNKKPMIQAIHPPTTTIQIAKSNLKPYSEIYELICLKNSSI